MLRIGYLTVEDEGAEAIYRKIHSELNNWLFIKKGLVKLHDPGRDDLRWVTNLEDWQHAVEELLADNDLVFCTVDLKIPKHRGSTNPDPKWGLQIVHQIMTRRKEGLQCCVLTGLESSDVQERFGDEVPDVLFAFKSDVRSGYDNIVNAIKSQALDLIETVSYSDSSGEERTILLADRSRSLRDHYLSRAVYYSDRSTWHVPTLIMGTPGLGRRSFVRFVSFLAESQLTMIDLDLKSFAENRICYRELERLRQEIEAAEQGADVPKQLCYVANLDEYVPGVSGSESENCLRPLEKILQRIKDLGSTQKRGFPYTIFISITGASRLRIRSRETRALIGFLEECIGVTTDFPLKHLASDINGWTVTHPRTLQLPSISDCGREFLQNLTNLLLESLRLRLAESLPTYRGQSLTLADDVLDLLIDKMDWSCDKNFAGFVEEFENAFERFLEQRSADQYQITRSHLGELLLDRFRRAVLNVDDVELEFPQKRGEMLRVVDRADLHVEDGELLVIVGPSGCGKSSVLRMLAGLLKPTRGTVTYRGKAISGPRSEIGFIFQDYSLFPWLSVRQNVEFGPRLKSEDSATYSPRLAKLLEVARLKGFEDSLPRQLSGGMQQRVAIVRALANEPDVLLMDEPFGALDVQTRWRMQDFLIQTKVLTGKTIVFVTHDIDEAVFIGDRIYVTTPRPMKIRQEIKIPFSANARTENLRTDPLFVSYVNRVREALLTDIRSREGDRSVP